MCPLWLCVPSATYYLIHTADAAASSAVPSIFTTWVAVAKRRASNAVRRQRCIPSAFVYNVVTFTAPIEHAAFEPYPWSLQLPSCVLMPFSPIPLAVVTLSACTAAPALGPAKASVAATMEL